MRLPTKMYYALVDMTNDDGRHRRIMDGLFKAGRGAGLTETTARDLVKQVSSDFFDGNAEALGFAIMGYADYLDANFYGEMLNACKESPSFANLLEAVAMQTLCHYDRFERGVKTLKLARWIAEFAGGDDVVVRGLLMRCGRMMADGIIKAFCTTLDKTERANWIREALGVEMVEPEDEVKKTQDELLGLWKINSPSQRDLDKAEFLRNKLIRLKGADYVEELWNGVAAIRDRTSKD